MLTSKIVFCRIQILESTSKEGQAIAEAVRVRQYFPYRIHGIYFDGTAWGAFNATSKRRQNDLLRKCFEVYLIA